MPDRGSLNWQVLDLINDLIAERGITKTELVAKSGMKRNTLFVKLRGETAMTTDDIAMLCDALGADPELVLRKAWEGRMRDMPRPSDVTGDGDDDFEASDPPKKDDMTLAARRVVKGKREKK